MKLNRLTGTNHVADRDRTNFRVSPDDVRNQEVTALQRGFQLRHRESQMQSALNELLIANG